MAKEMLINTVEGRECRIATVTNGRLEELYVERVSSASRVGNIYKGRITNVEPSIQAAFVDFGSIKNGFLHISDVHPQYFPKGLKGTEVVGRKRGHRDRPPIQECLRRGQEVIAQMTKEGIGTKGPTLTTYISIPGRLLVMMPGMSRLGVSRKIENEESREKIKQMLDGIALPPDMGIIVRTAGEDRPKRELQRDLTYLMRLWKTISARIRSTKAPAEIYQESDLVTRTIRDVYNAEISRIVCDTPAVAVQVRDFLDVAVPRSKHVIEVYVGKEGLFHDYGLEAEIEKMYSRRVELRSGGSLVIDQAEALVAIDVNSGRFREHSDAETTALKMNTEAAEEIARQLRLRDLGGVIIIDFIDMREEKNRRAVEKALRDAIKPDRAKTKVLKISAFGIVEMTRQRVRPSLKDSIHRTCSHCLGTGVVKSDESLALSVIRDLQRATSHDDVAQIEVSLAPSVAYHLSNYQRRQLNALESQSNKTIIVKPDDSLAGNEIRITCRNNRGSEIAWQRPQSSGQAAKALTTISVDQVDAGSRPMEPDLEGAQIDENGEHVEPPAADVDDAVRALEELQERPEEEDAAMEPEDQDAEQPPEEQHAPAAGPGQQPQQQQQAHPGAQPQGEQGPSGRSRRRRGRRSRGKGRQQGQPAQQGQPQAQGQAAGQAQGQHAQGGQAPVRQQQQQPRQQPRQPQQAAPAIARPAQGQPIPPVAAAPAIATAAPHGGPGGQSQQGQPDLGAPPKRRRTRRGGRKHRRKNTGPQQPGSPLDSGGQGHPAPQQVQPESRPEPSARQSDDNQHPPDTGI